MTYNTIKKSYLSKRKKCIEQTLLEKGKRFPSDCWRSCVSTVLLVLNLLFFLRRLGLNSKKNK